MSAAKPFDVDAYMKRRCMCGAPRSQHAHFHTNDGSLQILAVQRASCTGFKDEIEFELGGNPLDNAHLGPLIREKLGRVPD
jgi:hypothetical protein